jgi:hypothetical protein
VDVLIRPIYPLHIHIALTMLESDIPSQLALGSDLHKYISNRMITGGLQLFNDISWVANPPDPTTRILSRIDNPHGLLDMGVSQ